MINAFKMFEGRDTIVVVMMHDKVIGTLYRLDDGKDGEPRRWGGTAHICGLEEFPTVREALAYIRRSYTPETAG